ncbi:hypothetical protein DAPPUDRAFT_312371 [Daphnia pulex]|uniref:SAM domain-containing protein n=1 Tax=Daphnia pulex TaxID=6669 RepID=E9G0M1_DAPPU|nr:hypothetical protein DAPPUDRAFT_312371 [Daphnia pulex]|eukprot:EFX86929.1 hypothetical protein DAPPUDRAFT_312371 [Daphnia pulex]
MQSLHKSLSALSLQSQSQSATLSMEVSYTFHSHLIGRSGQNINRVMEDTETRIHFPDRNRIAGESKSNSVVIRGPIANLENARQRIRADVPVEFIVDCNIEKINSVGQTNLTHHFSSSFGVLLRFYPKIDGISCQVNIRGQQDRLQQLKDSVVYFGRLTDTLVDAVVVKVETSFDHVWLLRDQVDKIIAATGAGIRCPDVSILKELPKKYCVWIRGSLDQVYKASTMLNGLLPMQLMVQVPSDRFNRSILADNAKEADVMIRVERTTSDMVTIRFTSYEWNALLSSLKLAESSSSQSGPAQQQQLGVIGVDIPQSSSTSSSDSGATSLSSPRAGDSCIPASMAASRFDQNSSRHLSQLLDTVGLSHYADLFVQNEVDLAMFTTLKDEDFISIGIRSFGARKIMLNAIQELRR